MMYEYDNTTNTTKKKFTSRCLAYIIMHNNYTRGNTLLLFLVIFNL